MQNRRILSSGSLATDAVRNTAGEVIADVKEIMIDIVSGRVAYVVISYGGLMGLGGKLFALPWDAVRVDQENRCLVVDLDAESLASAPGFDKDEWPDFADPEWTRQVHEHYGLDDVWLLT